MAGVRDVPDSGKSGLALPTQGGRVGEQVTSLSYIDRSLDQKF